MKMDLASALVARSRAIVLAASCAAGLAVAVTGIGQPVENLIDSMRVRFMPRHASDKIAVIEIDDKSLKEVHAWPWPRSVHGQLIRRLRSEHAGHISFDVDFSNPAGDARQDQMLAKALREPGAPVSLAAIKATGALPNPALAPYATISSVWIETGTSGIARSVTYGDRIGNAIRPSISSFVTGGTAVHSGNLAIDWSIRQDTIPVYSYADVLAGRIPESSIRGRGIIIGATAVGMGDHWVTPVDTSMQGVMVHAYGANTILLGGVVPMGRYPLLLLAAVVIALTTMSNRRWKRNVAITSAAIGTIAIQWAVRNILGWQLDANAALATYAAAAALLGVTSLMSAIIRQITTDPNTSLPNLQAMRIEKPEGVLVVAVRLSKNVEIAASLGAETRIGLIRRMYDRLDLAASGAHIYQVDEHSFAWRSPHSVEETYDVIEALHALFSAGIQIGELTVDTSITIGLCDLPDLSIERAVSAALLAADRAEQRGLKWEKYETDDDADWKLSILGEVDRAIENGDLWVAYQPKFDIKAGRITGSEALVRWTHPKRGFIAPDRFIPVVEEAGRIDKLTMYVLERAIRDFAPLGDLTVAVNLSMRLFGRTPLLEPVKEMLARHGMPAKRLTLEVTESAQMDKDAEAACIAELEALRDLGISISIDDYGTGQSTLSYVQKLPAAELKIDRGFVSKLPSSRSDLVLVDMTIQTAHMLGLKVVAEGVENDEVLQTLADMGCDIIQGYFISKPVALADFVKIEDGRGISQRNKAA